MLSFTLVVLVLLQAVSFRWALGAGILAERRKMSHLPPAMSARLALLRSSAAKFFQDNNVSVPEHSGINST
jgi:hypothetical protein